MSSERYAARVLALIGSTAPVYNVEWNEAKDAMNSWIYEEKQGWSKRNIESIRHNDVYSKWYYGSPYSNQLPAYVANLRKLVAKTGDVVLSDLLATLEPLVGHCERLIELKDQKIMGRKPSTDPLKTPARTLANTGTCGVCGQNVKREDDGGLYHHGFKIEWEQRMGRCFGTGYQPHELSPDASNDYMEKVLRPYRNSQRDHAGWLSTGLKDGTLVEITSHFRTSGYRGRFPVYLKVTKGEPLFEQVVREEISYAESNAEMVSREIERREQIRDSWQPKALPR